jgi:hypothetical protein
MPDVADIPQPPPRPPFPRASYLGNSGILPPYELPADTIHMAYFAARKATRTWKRDAARRADPDCFKLTVLDSVIGAYVYCLYLPVTDIVS